MTILGDRVNFGLVRSALVAPLVCMDVVVRGGIHKTGRLRPVESPHDARPGCRWSQFFLTDVVIEATAVLAHTAAEHQGRDAGPIDQVGVVPVIDSSTDDD